MNRLAASIIEQVAKEYIEGIDLKKLNFSIFNGNLSLREVQLCKGKIICGTEIIKGIAGEIKAVIPWKNIKKKPVTCSVSNLTVEIRVLDALQSEDCGHYYSYSKGSVSQSKPKSNSNKQLKDVILHNLNLTISNLTLNINLLDRFRRPVILSITCKDITSFSKGGVRRTELSQFNVTNIHQQQVLLSSSGTITFSSTEGFGSVGLECSPLQIESKTVLENVIDLVLSVIEFPHKSRFTYLRPRLWSSRDYWKYACKSVVQIIKISRNRSSTEQLFRLRILLHRWRIRYWLKWKCSFITSKSSDTTFQPMESKIRSPHQRWVDSISTIRKSVSQRRSLRKRWIRAIYKIILNPSASDIVSNEMSLSVRIPSLIVSGEGFEHNHIHVSSIEIKLLSSTTEIISLEFYMQNVVIMNKITNTTLVSVEGVEATVDVPYGNREEKLTPDYSVVVKDCRVRTLLSVVDLLCFIDVVNPLPELPGFQIKTSSESILRQLSCWHRSSIIVSGIVHFDDGSWNPSTRTDDVISSTLEMDQSDCKSNSDKITSLDEEETPEQEVSSISSPTAESTSSITDDKQGRAQRTFQGIINKRNKLKDHWNDVKKVLPNKWKDRMKEQNKNTSPSINPNQQHDLVSNWKSCNRKRSFEIINKTIAFIVFDEMAVIKSSSLPIHVKQIANNVFISIKNIRTASIRQVKFNATEISGEQIDCHELLDRFIYNRNTKPPPFITLNFRIQRVTSLLGILSTNSPVAKINTHTKSLQLSALGIHIELPEISIMGERISLKGSNLASDNRNLCCLLTQCNIKINHSEIELPKVSVDVEKNTATVTCFSSTSQINSVTVTTGNVQLVGINVDLGNIKIIISDFKLSNESNLSYVTSETITVSAYDVLSELINCEMLMTRVCFHSSFEYIVDAVLFNEISGDINQDDNGNFHGIINTGGIVTRCEDPVLIKGNIKSVKCLVECSSKMTSGLIKATIDSISISCFDSNLCCESIEINTDVETDDFSVLVVIKPISSFIEILNTTGHPHTFKSNSDITSTIKSKLNPTTNTFENKLTITTTDTVGINNFIWCTAASLIIENTHETHNINIDITNFTVMLDEIKTPTLLSLICNKYAPYRDGCVLKNTSDKMKSISVVAKGILVCISDIELVASPELKLIVQWKDVVMKCFYHSEICRIEMGKKVILSVSPTTGEYCRDVRSSTASIGDISVVVTEEFLSKVLLLFQTVKTHISGMLLNIIKDSKLDTTTRIRTRSLNTTADTMTTISIDVGTCKVVIQTIKIIAIVKGISIAAGKQQQSETTQGLEELISLTTESISVNHITSRGIASLGGIHVKGNWKNGFDVSVYPNRNDTVRVNLRGFYNNNKKHDGNPSQLLQLVTQRLKTLVAISKLPEIHILLPNGDEAQIVIKGFVIGECEKINTKIEAQSITVRTTHTNRSDIEVNIETLMLKGYCYGKVYTATLDSCSVESEGISTSFSYCDTLNKSIYPVTVPIEKPSDKIILSTDINTALHSSVMLYSVSAYCTHQPALENAPGTLSITKTSIIWESNLSPNTGVIISRDDLRVGIDLDSWKGAFRWPRVRVYSLVFAVQRLVTCSEILSQLSGGIIKKDKIITTSSPSTPVTTKSREMEYDIKLLSLTFHSWLFHTFEKRNLPLVISCPTTTVSSNFNCIRIVRRESSRFDSGWIPFFIDKSVSLSKDLILTKRHHIVCSRSVLLSCGLFVIISLEGAVVHINDGCVLQIDNEQCFRGFAPEIRGGGKMVFVGDNNKPNKEEIKSLPQLNSKCVWSLSSRIGCIKSDTLTSLKNITITMKVSDQIKSLKITVEAQEIRISLLNKRRLSLTLTELSWIDVTSDRCSNNEMRLTGALTYQIKLHRHQVIPLQSWTISGINYDSHSLITLSSRKCDFYISEPLLETLSDVGINDLDCKETTVIVSNFCGVKLEFENGIESGGDQLITFTTTTNYVDLVFTDWSFSIPLTGGYRSLLEIPVEHEAKRHFRNRLKYKPIFVHITVEMSEPSVAKIEIEHPYAITISSDVFKILQIDFLWIASVVGTTVTRKQLKLLRDDKTFYGLSEKPDYLKISIREEDIEIREKITFENQCHGCIPIGNQQSTTLPVYLQYLLVSKASGQVVLDLCPPLIIINNLCSGISLVFDNCEHKAIKVPPGEDVAVFYFDVRVAQEATIRYGGLGGSMPLLSTEALLLHNNTSCTEPEISCILMKDSSKSIKKLVMSLQKNRKGLSCSFFGTEIVNKTSASVCFPFYEIDPGESCIVDFSSFQLRELFSTTSCFDRAHLTETNTSFDTIRFEIRPKYIIRNDLSFRIGEIDSNSVKELPHQFDRSVFYKTVDGEAYTISGPDDDMVFTCVTPTLIINNTFHELSICDGESSIPPFSKISTVPQSPLQDFIVIEQMKVSLCKDVKNTLLKNIPSPGIEQDENNKKMYYSVANSGCTITVHYGTELCENEKDYYVNIMVTTAADIHLMSDTELLHIWVTGSPLFDIMLWKSEGDLLFNITLGIKQLVIASMHNGDGFNQPVATLSNATCSVCSFNTTRNKIQRISVSHSQKDQESIIMSVSVSVKFIELLKQAIEKMVSKDKNNQNREIIIHEVSTPVITTYFSLDSSSAVARSSLLTSLSSVDRVRFDIPKCYFTGIHQSSTEVIFLLRNHYVNVCSNLLSTSAVYIRSAASLNITGSPAYLLDRLSQGISDLADPISSSGSIPEFASGVHLGLRSISGNAIAGTSNSIWQLAKGFGAATAALTLDSEYQQLRRERLSKCSDSHNSNNALSKTTSAISTGITEGCRGCLRTPYAGYQQSGLPGLVTGSVHGFVSAPIKIITGTLDGLASVAETLHFHTVTNDVSEHNIPSGHRSLPLALVNGIVCGYNLNTSLAYAAIQSYVRDVHHCLLFITTCESNIYRYLFSNRFLFCVSGSWNTVWVVDYKSISTIKMTDQGFELHQITNGDKHIHITNKVEQLCLLDILRSVLTAGQLSMGGRGEISILSEKLQIEERERPIANLPLGVVWCSRWRIENEEHHSKAYVKYTRKYKSLSEVKADKLSVFKSTIINRIPSCPQSEYRIVEIFEHQSSILTSWKSSALQSRWCSRSGADLSNYRTKDNHPPSYGWKWVSEWCLDKTNTDPDGWQYVSNSQQWDSSPSLFGTLRRRRWTRPSTLENR